ncbi:Uncharacterised protein (plasmid) [Legionella adelaidensis]|uniref:Uncharacterized protein n=1 Tax=Legionella adelaidensis TaxID=45056 RepID=A0A0W0R5L5_9GAMM|nr:hypothetical protein [Legionella adelaidensis]KTC66401.1 hypothetical protein Lade_1059 [Legionella adelaidensis]VEH84999.1 Uncharacterised protein [Legionella adelaidensis]
MSDPTLEDYFKLVKENYQQYLERNMFTHLEIPGGIEKASTVKECAEKIAEYHPTKNRYLEKAITQASFGTKLGRGALGALVGLGVGGMAMYAQKNTSFLDFLNPMTGAKNAIGGAFSVLLGIGVGTLVYKALNANQEPAEEDLACILREMEKAGFKSETYINLSKELVKLFHFRECLLIGLKDLTGTDMRQECKQQMAQHVDEKDFDLAIEVYFLQQLNALFQQAFQDIYQEHDQTIEKHSQESRLQQWLRSLFENPLEKEKFSQQLQIQFMQQCQNFLEAEMSESGFFASHATTLATFTGLIAGTIAVSASAALIGGPITISILAIGLVAACVSFAASYSLFNDSDFFQYKRSATNRANIKNIVSSIEKEVIRLKKRIDSVTETTPTDIKQLSKFDEITKHSWLGTNPHMANGSVSSWKREYASRYRHNEVIEINLRELVTGLITKAGEQTKQLQQELRRSGTLSPQYNKLPLFIETTLAYLKEPKNKTFVNKFEFIEKIKQQTLEIVAVMAPDDSLPQYLIDFYTKPVGQGGLGGALQDLQQVRILAPIPTASYSYERSHPYEKLLSTAQRFNYALTQIQNREFILAGDSTYREMLGLGVQTSSDDLEGKINEENIQKYLDESFAFLYYLNQVVSSHHTVKTLDESLVNSNEFNLYRMLLIKQLASLADPKNLRVTAEIRKKIKVFIEEKLKLDAEVVFDNVTNESLFCPRDTTGPTVDGLLNEKLPEKNLEFIADAIRLDLAYCSKPFTAKILIEDCVSLKDSEQRVFAYHSQAYFLPESTPEYPSKIKHTIECTKELIKDMANKHVLKTSGAFLCYVENVLSEVQRIKALIKQYDDQLPLTSGKKEGDFNSQHLQEAWEAMEVYTQELTLMVQKMKSEPGSRDSVQFGKFGQRPSYRELYGERWALWDEGGEETYHYAEKKQIPKNQIELFIAHLRKYEKERRERPDISLFNFFSYSKAAKIKAANDLISALTNFLENKPIELAFLDNNIYQDGELAKTIRTHLKALGLGDNIDIKDFFTTYTLFPCTEREIAQTPTAIAG